MFETILEEAQRLVHGERQRSYGHPIDDFTRTAGLISALLGHILIRPLRPEEVGLIMICVKLSREINGHKRDNLVDAAGYAETVLMCHQEREARDRALMETRLAHARDFDGTVNP